jgi:hypothetical protein
MQLLQSIDRVRRSISFDLQVRDRKALVVADGQAAQLEAVLGPRLLIDGLMRRYPCRNQ